MKTPAELRRLTIMRQRRLVKPKRRFNAIAIHDDGLTVVYRCRTCGHESGTRYDNQFAAKQMHRWHSKEMGGCSGECRRCTKEARDRLHPLPPRSQDVTSGRDGR